jgi:hypothetical protein
MVTPNPHSDTPKCDGHAKPPQRHTKVWWSALKRKSAMVQHTGVMVHINALKCDGMQVLTLQVFSTSLMSEQYRSDLIVHRRPPPLQSAN